MKVHRKSLLASTALRHAGIMYAPDPGGEGGGTSGGGGESGGGGNNGGGNGESGQNGGSNQNNGGQAFDYGQFWDAPVPKAGGETPSGGSAESSPGGGTQPKTAAQEFTEKLNSVEFNPVFDTKALEDLSAGKVEGVNKLIQDQMKQSVNHSVMMMANLMKQSNEHILQKVQSMLDGTLGARDDAANLGKHFPTYEKPGMKKVIDDIYARSKTLAGGDQTKALQHTKEMLRFLGTQGAGDLGLSSAPDDSHGGANNPGVQSLLDDLLQR